MVVVSMTQNVCSPQSGPVLDEIRLCIQGVTWHHVELVRDLFKGHPGISIRITGNLPPDARHLIQGKPEILKPHPPGSKHGIPFSPKDDKVAYNHAWYLCKKWKAPYPVAIRREEESFAQKAAKDTALPPVNRGSVVRQIGGIAQYSGKGKVLRINARDHYALVEFMNGKDWIPIRHLEIVQDPAVAPPAAAAAAGGRA